MRSPRCARVTRSWSPAGSPRGRTRRTGRSGPSASWRHRRSGRIWRAGPPCSAGPLARPAPPSLAHPMPLRRATAGQRVTRTASRTAAWTGRPRGHGSPPRACDHTRRALGHWKRTRRRRLRSGMAQYIYSMRKVRKAHGDKVILDDVTLAFLPGAKIGVVGPNGAGKSSVLRIMAGLDQPSNGDATLSPGYTVGMLQQEPPLNEDKTVLGNVEEGVAETKAMLERFNEIAEKMAVEYSDELLNEMGRLQEQLDHRGAWDLDSQLEQAMDALRCPPGDADVSVLSGGERRRVALCKLLLQQPDLLLLDEPTNHLDAESVQWLEQHLEKYPGCVVAVTHDRYFLDNVAEWILELDRGRAYPYEGNYSTYLETKATRLKVEGAKDAKRAK